MPNVPSIATVSLKSSLRAACSDPVEWRYDDDHGGKARRVAWKAPETVDPQMQADAERVSRQAEAALKPADVADVRKWLASLGLLCAGQMSASDAKLKLAAYAPLLDQPACCYTQDTLREAGKRFTWFPSFAELNAFLEEYAAPLKTMRDRLRKLAEAKVAIPEQRSGKRYCELSPEKKAELDRLMAPFRGPRGKPTTEEIVNGDW